MLRQIHRRSPLRIRHFSSSSPKSPPSNGYNELSEYVRRVVDRKDQLKRYQEHSIFPPDNWTIHNYYLYAQLQLPSKTEIDAVEFLNGARFACDRVIRSMHSQELIEFAADNSPRPQIADEMEQVFEPMCYQRMFLPRVRRLGVGVSSLELKELDFSGVYLSGVNCVRLTRASLKTEEKLRTVVEQTLAEKQKLNERPSVIEVVSDISAIKKKMSEVETDPEDDDEILERMQLTASFLSTQTVEAVSAKTSERMEVKTEVKTNLSFESLVTDPDDVDWRIIKLNQFGRTVSRTKGN